MTLPKVKVTPAVIDWGDMPRRFMNPGELETLIALVASVKPRGVLEFGVNEGRTAKAILQNVPGIKLYQGVDVLPGYVTAKEVQRKEVPADPGWRAEHEFAFQLLVRPRGSFDLAAEDLEPCDAVFIDGDHGRAGVLNDTALARELVRPGGIVVWHDYHNLGTVDVREVLDEMHAAGASIQHVENTWLAFERIPNG